MSLRIYRTFSLVIMRRLGRKALPVIKEGDIKAGRSAYNEQSGSVEKVLAMELRTESCLQVYFSKPLDLTRTLFINFKEN